MGRQRKQTQTIRSLRLNAGLTQDALARRARISRGTLGHLERGGRSPVFDYEAERRVAEVLGVLWETITFGTVDRDSDGTVDLYAERMARGLTEGEVAEQADVTLRTVRTAEMGGAVHPTNARKLADFYGVRVADFYPSALAEVAA